MNTNTNYCLMYLKLEVQTLDMSVQVFRQELKAFRLQFLSTLWLYFLWICFVFRHSLHLGIHSISKLLSSQCQVQKQVHFSPNGFNKVPALTSY